MLYYLFFAIFFFSCNDYTIDNKIQTSPGLVVHPENIDFGNLHSSFETGQSSFVIINAGDDDLIITKPQILLDDKFSLDDNLIEEYIILPGETLSFDVYYSPLTYEENHGKISFSSNDLNNEYFELPITGLGDAPLLSVQPANIDFGDVSVGCVLNETVTIKNNGNLNLLIEDLRQLVTPPSDILVDLGTLPNLPWELIPGQEIDIYIDYLPSDTNRDESIINVTSNDPVNPEISILQSGNGDIVHWFNERHVQDESKVVDIVFVVDNSGSMNDQQLELSFQMHDFVTILQNMRVDYHLGFITTDSSALRSYEGFDWIDNRHPDPVSWAAGVINSIGTGGSPFEQGIYYAYAFTSNVANSSRYWRPIANYVIVYISDEPDYSPNSYASYFSFFDNIKPSASLVRQFAVIGDYPSGCLNVNSANGMTYNVPYGAGYYEMTQRYNGQAYSICAVDWGMQMQNLATAVAIRSSFELLENNVMEDTIEVRVNGQIVTSWTYDVSTNSVIFDSDSIPEGGNTVDIDYAILGCGE